MAGVVLLDYAHFEPEGENHGKHARRELVGWSSLATKFCTYLKLVHFTISQPAAWKFVCGKSLWVLRCGIELDSMKELLVGIGSPAKASYRSV